MNTTEEWQDESGLPLSPEMAMKYMEAKTIFLCRLPFFGAVGESKVIQISPNGQYGKISFYGNEYWMKLADVEVVDTLVAMDGLQLPPDRPPVQRKPPVQQEKPPVQVGTEELTEEEKIRRYLATIEKLKKKYPNR